MLSPKYLEALPQPIIKIYSEFENELLGDIAKRITKADYLTPTAEWRLYKAEQLRLSSREITQKLARLTGRSEKEIRQLYTGALKEALRNDEKIYRAAIKAGCLSEDAEHKLDSYFGSVAFSNALKAGYRNTNGLMRNLCNSAAAQANSRLSDELDKAFLKVASGAYTADEAVYSAVQDLGKSGIKVINYSSGHKDKVDVAVRRAVITGIGQAAGNMQLSLAADMGCDLVEVTAHLGARPSHAVWQGHIYSLSGKDPKYPDFRSSTGYGTGAGLCGWNCRHSFYPYFEGLSKPNGVPFTREENDEVYRNTQKQRAYERAVRQSKRELAALDGARSATDDEALKQKLDRDFRRKAVTLKRREAKLEEHLRNTGLLPDNSRVRVDGFGRSVSQKAVWANKKQLTSSAGSGILNSNKYDLDAGRFKGKIDSVLNAFTDMKTPISITDLPDGHGTQIMKIIENAPKRIRELLTQYDIKVVNMHAWGVPHYDAALNAIRINITKIANDKRGRYKTVFHEAGHAIDAALGRISYDPAFRKALESDFANFKRIIGIQIGTHDDDKIYKYIEKELGLTPIASSSLDIISGITYCKCGNGHDEKYWRSNDKRLGKEAFAHFFEAYARSDKEKINLLTSIFPSGNKLFLSYLEGG